MANERHIEILRQGVEVWNKWRKNNPDMQPDLLGSNLAGLNLRNVDLRHVLITASDLRNADLQGAMLGGAILNESDLSTSNLRNADLFSVEFGVGDLIDADLTSADLAFAHFHHVNLMPPWFIDVDQFVGALRTAVERFLTDITADAPKLELISRRIRESYFSNGVLLGRPAR